MGSEYMSKILIIEDNEMHLELASELLNKAGHNILKAEDAQKGIEKAFNSIPDLILMDMDLPNLNGYEATKILKSDSKTKNIPVVAMTALVMKDDIKKAFEAGCSGFIAKPIDINSFSCSVKNYLKSNYCEEKNIDKIANKIYEKTYEKQILTDPKYSNRSYTTEAKKHKVLIVDDNPMNAELLKGIVEQLNKNTFISYSSKDALKNIQKEKFDLILLDIMMPEMSGYELIEFIQKSPQNKYTPVIFISALNETKDIIKGLELGSFGYITKPYNIDELKARILNILKIKDLQDELRYEKEKFDNVNKFSIDGIIVLDKELKIVSCSNQFLKWTNLSIDQILYTDFPSLIKKFTNKSDICLKDMLSVSNYCCIELNIENEEKILEINSSPIYTSIAEIDGYVFTFRDVTETKEIEKQKETFIATLTHDLKTPIRAEIRSLELLLNGSFGSLNVEQKELIQEIIYSSKFMFNMVDTLLTKYKYENGKIVLNKTLFDIVDLVKNCCNEIKYLIHEKNQQLTMNFENEKEMIFADPIEIKRVIINLLSNAITYSQHGGKIDITTKTEGQYITLAVKDNGKGISQDKIDTIFDKYVTYSKKFRQVGTGLGLYVSKMITEAHNGQITIESKEEEGSEFVLKIPKT
ncbi:MAG: response regulator [Candidatus Gastranaerophilaceae bacterium]